MEKKYNIILASNSPRRKELLKGLDLDFEVHVLTDVCENYPDRLPGLDVAEYIAREKAQAYICGIGDNDLIITADTVVVVDNDVLGKPSDSREAKAMLKKISGRTHHVVTGVCLTTKEQQRHFSVVTDVTFRQLSDSEIDYYIRNYRPFDKAGAYGIQEWIGYIGVTSISGSYFNVMGLPVQRIYDELGRF